VGLVSTSPLLVDCVTTLDGKASKNGKQHISGSICYKPKHNVQMYCIFSNYTTVIFCKVFFFKSNWANSLEMSTLGIHHTYTLSLSKSPFIRAEKQTSLCAQTLDQCRKPCSCVRQLSGIRHTMWFDMLIHCSLATSSLHRFKNACINGSFFDPPQGLQHK